MTIDDGSLVRFLIGAQCVKYDVLDELFRDVDITKYRMAVMLVDGHSIVARLYHDRKIASVYAGSSAEIVRDMVVGFLNVLGHYRRYMSTRFHLDNDIYVMFNREKPVYNQTYCRSFNETRIDRYDVNDPTNGFTSRAINLAWEFILGLSPYFEGIYCLNNSGIDDYALMSRMGFPDDVMTLMMSTSDYGTQLLRPNWFLLHPKRDRSYLITRKTCYKKGVLKGVKHDAPEGLTPEMLPLYWSIVGCDDVSVPSLKIVQSKTLIDAMGRMVADGYLTPETTIAGFMENLPSYVSSSAVQLKASKSRIEDRYRALSARLSGLAITPDQIARISAQIYDIYNQNELEQLNEILVQGRLDPEILHLENLNMSAGVNREIYDGWE